MTTSNIKSPLERQARSGRPRARDRGEVILETRALFKTVLLSGWRPCRVCLTPDGITLTQGGRLVLEVPANLIVGSHIRQMRSVLGIRKQVLCVKCHTVGGKHNPSRVWLTGPDIHTLREKLADLVAASALDIAAIEKLVPHLDADAESIIRFLWDRRHATIRELAEHARMPSHMDILLKIREVINPLAEELFGFPLLTFASVRHDPFTGEDVSFSWWVVGTGGKSGVHCPEIVVDTFDETDNFSILACLPCGEDAEVNISFSEREVEVSSGKDVKPISVSLPTGVEPENCRQTFRNGILELRWDRRSQRVPAIEREE